jgi:hypothetical protein
MNKFKQCEIEKTGSKMSKQTPVSHSSKNMINICTPFIFLCCQLNNRSKPTVDLKTFWLLLSVLIIIIIKSLFILIKKTVQSIT